MDLENINLNEDNNESLEKENQNGIEISSTITSTSHIKETLEENKENDQNSNKECIQNSIDVKPILRLVPLEKLLAPQTTIQHSLSPCLEQSNSKELMNSSIIILDDSDNDDNNIEKNLVKKSIKINNPEKLRKTHKHKYSSSDCDDSNDKFNKINKQSTVIRSHQNNRPTRNSLRAKTLAKIKQALASSSSEEDDDDNVDGSSEIDISNKHNKKTSHKLNTAREQDFLEQVDISRNESDIRNSCKEIFIEKQNKNLVTSKPSSLTSNSTNNKDNGEQNEQRLVVRLKRSTNQSNNKSQTENYEITSSNTEQTQNHLLIDKNSIIKSHNANIKSKNKENPNINSVFDSNERKFDSSDSETSDELQNSRESKSKQLANKKQELDNSKQSYSKESINVTEKSNEQSQAYDENVSLNNCKNSRIDKIETAKKQKHITFNKTYENSLLNINCKLKKFKIQLKRLSVNEMKNIIKQSIKSSDYSKDMQTKLKSHDTNKSVPRPRIIHGLASTSEEEEVIKKNGEQRSNRRKESNSNDNEDDNNKDDDDDTNIKAKQPKSTTNMSSSEDDIIQQDEDKSSDNDSNNSSELIRKRTVTVRAKKSTQRSDEEYILNSDDVDDEDGISMIKKNSDNDDDDYESDNKKKIKRKQTSKRKRIKNASESSDDDEAGGSKQKRKNIRKLIKTKELNLDTKQAAQEEKDRRKRIEERQRLYNSIYEKPETTELAELVLDFDEDTKKPLLKVDTGLLKLLKPHQATGVKFMWDACFETLKEAEESPGSGCILAHCMGLGKTLQVIALTHTLLTNSRKTNIERVLIITPLSTLTNWAREYHHWMRSCKNKNIEVYDMSKFKDKTLRTYKLNEWFEEGGVCIMGYDMYRILSNEKTKGLRKKQRETLQQCLVDPGADIVICDEGHLLKNEKTSISKAVTKMRTRRRIVLTGTPLQNNLKEYYCMIQFIKPNLLGTYKEYLNRFVNPITNGQYTDSTERDIRLMKHRSHILHTLLEGCLQRRDYSVLAPYLPPKHEYVIYITLSDVQKTLYEFYMTKQRNHMEDMTGKGAKLFQDFQNLRRIWTHPMCLRVNSDIAIKKRLLRDDTDEEGSLKDFIDDNSASSSSDSDSGSFNSDKSIESVKNIKRIKTRNQRLNASDDSDIEEVPIIVNKEDPSEWWCQMVPKEEISNINHSPKLLLLMKVLDECEQIGDKLLLFSQSLQSLDVIEEFLSFINRRTQGIEIDCNINDFTGIWQPGVDYFRLDGSSSVEQRDAMCKGFNNVHNLRARLFLISTRAGSLGINLVAANRVIIFDVSWNPSHDTQSIFRVYRFGQDKPCYIYRFIAMGTMEQKVYERQVAKQAMAKRVIDEQQIGRHYNQNDLLELYTYELESRVPRAIPILPKDRLFADLLANYEKLIYKYHEHDSLLENQENDNLTEEERKAAWDEYETEKNRPPQQQYVMYNRPTYTIGPGGYQAHHGPVTSNKIFGFRTDILLRLLNMKVGRDHPQLTPNEIVQMVPSYLQQLYSEMNHNNPTMYKELLELHQHLEMPAGYYMNPLLYSNQNQMESTRVNPYANRPPPTISTEIVEID